MDMGKVDNCDYTIVNWSNRDSLTTVDGINRSIMTTHLAARDTRGIAQLRFIRRL
jgi:hypothetical protein